ncbi:hypothetical protein GWI33_010320, partial [Rhynchophorus ferrugineus]
RHITAEKENTKKRIKTSVRNSPKRQKTPNKSRKSFDISLGGVGRRYSGESPLTSGEDSTGSGHPRLVSRHLMYVPRPPASPRIPGDE